MKKINLSLVLYNSDPKDITRIINTFNDSSLVNKIYLIDNSPNNSILKKIQITNKIKYIFNNKNIGYGAGHNVALKKSLINNISYHLVVNADIYFKTQNLKDLYDHMEKNLTIGSLMPKILNTNKSVQNVVKLLPTPLDLFGRGFLPKFLNQKRNLKYTISNFNYDNIIESPNLSGCFMFLRVNALKDVGLFDERYFMYAEDIDLTRRINSKYKTIVYPYINVIHRHEKASFKSFKMKIIHSISVIKYFNKWGWIYDSERSRINKKILSQF